jgi:hypothetical protein
MLHLMPQLWFRNTWSWKANSVKPKLSLNNTGVVAIEHPGLGIYQLSFDGQPNVLFCDNDTNVRRLYDQQQATGYFKDGFHEYIVNGNHQAINARQIGTKAGIHYQLSIPAGESSILRLYLSKSSKTLTNTDFDQLFATRLQEADEFYADLQKGINDSDVRNVQRQAFAGMIWSKQFYYYDVPEWLKGDSNQPAPPESRKLGRNYEWTHLNNADIISMPDKWEYPWYASWDLAFHTIPFALIDIEFAKSQLLLLSLEWYIHPNGQLPAYEWDFSDVNPPVHAWATWCVFEMDKKQRQIANPEDKGDLAFLKRIFLKLMLNFTWWVNRKDAQGRNIFQGGFLGLDNISVFDNSVPLPDGYHINQADGTSWMAMYSLNLMRIALELAKYDTVYEEIGSKFFEHYLLIADAINNIGGDDYDSDERVCNDCIGLWSESDQFYYNMLHLPTGQSIALKVRSMVGLIPLFAVEILEPELLEQIQDFTARLEWFLKHRPFLARMVSNWEEPGIGKRRLLSLLRGHRMKALLKRMLDESEFLSDYGVRSMSKAHKLEPFRYQTPNQVLEVSYWPAESQSGMFGGNSNWRGPIWMPVNYLIIESLKKFHSYYGDDFKVECPTGSGKFMTIIEVADELAQRLIKLFLKGEDGLRPVLKDHPKLAADPHFKDYVLFHEYFHGDSGRGIGASHQTGWTALIASLLQSGSDPA